MAGGWETDMIESGFSAEQQALRERARGVRERAVLPYLQARGFGYPGRVTAM